MIIEFSEADESRVRWSKDGKEWKSADLDELIEAWEQMHKAYPPKPVWSEEWTRQ